MAIDTVSYIEHHYPRYNKLPNLFRKIIAVSVRRLFHEDEINSFLKENQNKDSFSFVESVLDYFDISISVYTNQLDRIPPYGRVVIIANHPLGALDAMALIHILKSVRKDIKIVANSFLSSIESLRDLIIPIDNINGKMTKETLSRIYGALEKEQVVIMFPSGEVSRIKPTGVKDTPWQGGFYKIAKRTRSPILPIYIQAKNSNTFYAISTINKSLSTAFLPQEMFKFRGKKISFNIGKAIPPKSHDLPLLSKKEMIKLLRKHFYRVSKNKKPIFKTQNSISIAEDRAEISKALKDGVLLGNTSDGKEIILYETDVENCVIKEIGRLREISFRQVGEGSGNKRDIDEYDFYYKHIIIWDRVELEIAGAYRLAVGSEILQLHGKEGLYTSEFFEFDEEFDRYIEQGVELGRSFVQPAYWNSRALDYLWQGIGAFLSKNPQIRYLFGAVSLSNSFNPTAKAFLIYFYTHYFGAKQKLVRHKMPYSYPNGMEWYCSNFIKGVDYKSDLKALKEELSYTGNTIPTLYKQYSELCEEGGVQFFDFGYDVDFNTIDGFIMADISMIKPSKKKRYFAQNN